MRYIEGDLFKAILDVKDKDIFIAHCCNDIGAFGAGFVVPLGRAYPKSQESYLNWFKTKKDKKDGPFALGETQFVEVSKTPKIVVCNMIGQQGLGQNPRAVRYNHISRCLDAVADVTSKYKNPVIHSPMFGAGLAGGDWNIIEQLIVDAWERRGLSVTMYYLAGTLPTNWKLPKE